MTYKRKICVVTGTRAEYGVMKALMEKIEESEKLELQIIATGMHLLPEFGLTIREIRGDGFKIDAEVPMVIGGDKKRSMAMSIGAGIISITQAIDILNPDIVVVLGDRFEGLAAAIGASYSGKVLAHLSGGDNPRAGYDEYTRHAITKIAHIHFPTTKKSAERVIKMGENSEYVFHVGATALDTILNKELPSKDFLHDKYGLKSDVPIALIVQHPLSTSPETARDEMRITLEAIIELKLKNVLIYPNVDPGGREIIEAIKEFEGRYPDLIKGYKSLPFEEYLGLMSIADVMVGNSSSGIIESSSFHLPVINIGPRQEGRERAENLIDVGHNKEKIKEAINKALHNEEFKDIIRKCKNPYGDGKASERIVKVLSEIKLDKTLLDKKLTY